jgi:hypothetical protein
MRSIIRCPACYTFVYSDARHCHGCGQRIGKRQLLTRGSWVFIVLAVAAFIVFRGVDLQQDRHFRLRQQMEKAESIESTRNFLRTWFTAMPEELARKLAPRKTFAKDLQTLRDRFPSVFPAADVISPIEIEELDYTSHSQTGSELAIHNREDSPPTRRATDPRRSSVTYSARGKSRRSWTTDTFRFTTDVVKDGQEHHVTGRVCVDEGEVVCVEVERAEPLSVGRVDAVERVTIPR